VLPLLPGVPERHTHDYLRSGTTNLYAAVDVASGRVIADMSPRQRADEFRRFLNLIERSVPAHLDVHVVLDNSSTHKTPSIQRWSCATPASRCTSRPSTAHGSTSSSAASLN
jgi:DDE superfamily endonuclease